MRKLLLALVIWFALYGVGIAAVNINTATKEELTTLKGIGDKRAQDIIDYRTKNGSFKSVDELEKVPGIGPGTMKQIRSQLTTTGKTVVDKPAATDTKSKAGESTKAAKSETKKAESAKGDAMKADTAKEKTSAQSKPEDKAKAPAKADEKKAEKK